MSNRKNTRKENLNRYADMLHRQNIANGQPKPGEVRISKPFEQEKEIKMEQQEVVKTNEEIQEELSSSVLRECYILVREKIWDKLSDEERAVITEEYSEEAAAAIRAYAFKLSEDEMKELFSETLKEAVNGELFNITSDLLAKAEAEQAKNDEKVDLMEVAMESIKAKAEAVEEKVSESTEEEIEEVEKVAEEVVEKVEKTVEEVTDVADEVKEEKTESEQDSETTTTGEEKVSPESKGFIWPMDKFNEMFPG